MCGVGALETVTGKTKCMKQRKTEKFTCVPPVIPDPPSPIQPDLVNPTQPSRIHPPPQPDPSQTRPDPTLFNRTTKLDPEISELS